VARSKSVFICEQCGFKSPKWLGKCPECSNWNSFVESLQTTRGASITNTAHVASINLDKVKISSTKRTPTGIAELDTALGGGVVSGQVVLLAGEPGIGKSTLLLQVAAKVKHAVYVAGEESAGQIKLRAGRLGLSCGGVEIYEETDIGAVLGTVFAMKMQPDILIVDSIQTMFTPELQGIPGSVGQVKESAFRLIQYAKRNNVPVFIVGHVTKEGSVAGPSTLAHMVDTVCWFEGDKTLEVRMVRAVKNRFGPTNEVGLFAMREKGLVSLDDSQAYFLQTTDAGLTSGSVKTCIMEGTRPLLVEVQALVNPTKLMIPRRVAQGFDSRRLETILAVLMKHMQFKLNERDVYINIVGGIQIKDPGADLAIALAVASSYKNTPLDNNLVAFGEMGLLGELRPLPFEEQRIKQSKKRGYAKVYSPQSHNSIRQVFSQLF